MKLIKFLCYTSNHPELPKSYNNPEIVQSSLENWPEQPGKFKAKVEFTGKSRKMTLKAI
jgi:hypothetical protein